LPSGPHLADKKITLDVISSIDHQIERYLLVRLAISAIVAVATGLSLALISPLLVSRAGEINTVAVFVSVLVCGWMWDVWGLLLAVPIMVAVKAAADHVESMKPVGELLGR
jgi:predicted PurR-regulated permease PerM